MFYGVSQISRLDHPDPILLAYNHNHSAALATCSRCGKPCYTISTADILCDLCLFPPVERYQTTPRNTVDKPNTWLAEAEIAINALGVWPPG